jgi:hypothetical protein
VEAFDFCMQITQVFASDAEGNKLNASQGHNDYNE